MDRELQNYYEERLAMVGSTAWRDLIEDVEAMLASTNNLDGVESEKSLHFKKGEISIMRWILTLEETSKLAYEQLKGNK